MNETAVQFMHWYKLLLSLYAWYRLCAHAVLLSISYRHISLSPVRRCQWDYELRTAIIFLPLLTLYFIHIIELFWCNIPHTCVCLYNVSSLLRLSTCQFNYCCTENYQLCIHDMAFLFICNANNSFHLISFIAFNILPETQISNFFFSHLFRID